MSSEADIIGHIHKVLLPHFQKSPIESLVALVLNILNESSMDMLLARMGSETDIINTWGSANVEHMQREPYGSSI